MRSRSPFFQAYRMAATVQYTEMGVSARSGPEDMSVMRPTIVEVRLARLTENYRAIRTAVAPAAVMPIVKANAYGHGLVDVARHLIGLGAPSLGVGLLEEAVALRDADVTTPLRHMANSGAILQFPESHLDMVRPGILMYGVYPSTEVRRTIAVRPAMTWKSGIVYFKVVQPGHPVSYGSTWQSDHP